VVNSRRLDKLGGVDSRRSNRNHLRHVGGKDFRGRPSGLSGVVYSRIRDVGSVLSAAVHVSANLQDRAYFGFNAGAIPNGLKDIRVTDISVIISRSSVPASKFGGVLEILFVEARNLPSTSEGCLTLLANETQTIKLRLDKLPNSIPLRVPKENGESFTGDDVIHCIGAVTVDFLDTGMAKGSKICTLDMKTIYSYTKANVNANASPE